MDKRDAVRLIQNCQVVEGREVSSEESIIKILEQGAVTKAEQAIEGELAAAKNEGRPPNRALIKQLIDWDRQLWPKLSEAVRSNDADQLVQQVINPAWQAFFHKKG